MCRLIGNRVGLADAVGIAALGDDQIVGREAAGIADGERKCLYWMADRPPYLHDGEAAREKIIRLLWQEIAHTLRGRPLCVIDIHADHRLADFPALAVAIVGR